MTRPRMYSIHDMDRVRGGEPPHRKNLLKKKFTEKQRDRMLRDFCIAFVHRYAPSHGLPVSQRQLARAFGLSRSAVQSVLNGQNKYNYQMCSRLICRGEVDSD
jgi:DNA invertase Pin-like site-specific DNA recombinase